MTTNQKETKWNFPQCIVCSRDLEDLVEDFIHKVFKTLYGDHYENYSYDDVLKKIKLLKEEN